VVDAILLASQSNLFDGSRFHLVDSARITQNDVVKQYLRSTRASLKVTYIPLAAVYGLGFGVELLARLLGRPAPLSVYRVRSAMAPLSFDGSAARDRLGWEPRIGVSAWLEEAARTPQQIVSTLEKEYVAPH
jgi:nucleoside-diphosphate-sugar epimerase